jgi:hypothetical protein
VAPQADQVPPDQVPSETARAWRRAVLELRSHDRRRRIFAPVVHVGRPGERTAAFGIRSDEPTDLALRTDVVAALMRRAGASSAHPPLVWLTRPGEHALHDVDADWMPAAAAAYAEAGLPLAMVVVTREGWWDPLTGHRRVWKRLRARSSSLPEKEQ